MKTARAHWEADRLDCALADAWKAYDAAPEEHAAKVLVARILMASPTSITADRGSALRRLLCDRDIDPRVIAPAGWHYILQTSDLFSADAMADPAVMAKRLEANEFARELLTEAVVTNINAEISLTRLRRWLLLFGGWRDYPKSVEALTTQAALNGGAWIFDSEERARLEKDDSVAIARAYRPKRQSADNRAAFSDPVTRAVAEQYETWPYPQWTRAMATKRTTLPTAVQKLDPDGPDTIPQAAHILIAGCGTGYQVALESLRYPDAKITAIDISETSLRYGAERCSKAGLHGIEFRTLDLHRVSELGRQFDAIFCTGVLHHLPDPEKGWAALVDVLKPGGVMHVMVYSKIARMRLRVLQAFFFTDLVDRPVDDDLLREVRRRVIDQGPAAVPATRDFYSLASVHDLLLHRHEDPFDVPRIQRALDRLGLKLIHFTLPSPRDSARYRAENPHDPLQRDFAAWATVEKRNRNLFFGMYDFWCRKLVA
jgi:2-polyprenyl-3-methyl-5-hydroxy-6-metoxy-1,4-benzoquinol methylase